MEIGKQHYELTTKFIFPPQERREREINKIGDWEDRSEEGGGGGGPTGVSIRGFFRGGGKVKLTFVCVYFLFSSIICV